MSNCRWVVLAEQCYEQLARPQRLAVPPSLEPPLLSKDVSVSAVEKNPEGGVSLVTAAPYQPPEFVLSTGDKPPQEFQATANSGAAANTSVAADTSATADTSTINTSVTVDTSAAADNSGVDNTEEATEPPKWTSNLPPSYQKDASRFLEDLESRGDFRVDTKGHLVLDGRKINYLVGDFLRITHIPYNQGTLPVEVETWLRGHNMTKFRNPLLKIRPKWKSMYPLRRSTRAKRKGV